MRYGQAGLSLRYLPGNQAWAVMWCQTILKICPAKTDADAYLRELIGTAVK